MENKFMENLQDYNKSAMASAKALETINTQLIEKLTGKQMELANATFETGTRYFSSLTEVKGYQDLLAEQTKLASEYNEKLIEAARETADIIAEARESYQAWMEESLKSMTGNVDFSIPGLKEMTAKTASKKAA